MSAPRKTCVLGSFGQLRSNVATMRTTTTATGVVLGAAAAYLSYETLKTLLVGKEKWEKVGVVASLHFYPIKSCKGVAVDEIQLDKFGAMNDRRFMIIDSASQRFVTQRQEPSLCKIKATVLAGGSLSLSAPGMDDFVFHPRLQPEPGADLLQAGIWRHSVEGVDQGPGVAAWLTTYLGRHEVRLIGMSQTCARPTNWLLTPRDTPGQTAFSDGYPLLIISDASLADLNSRFAAASPPSLPLPMERFRPNIVVDTATPFAEDTWSRIRIGKQEMKVVKPCDRCKVPTIDQRTGEVGEEPTKTLSTYRRKEHVRTVVGSQADVFFGQNAIHLSQAVGGSISVNDEVWARRVRYPWTASTSLRLSEGRS